ncbi:MAG: rhodanese-like domain-containing protein [Gammaproteobacteria bacterium]|nr:rhodanese-like domain-containing protein [Gammaproteobacteria bacterium]
MFKKSFIAIAISSLVFSAPMSSAYDAEMAQSYHKFFSQVSGQELGKALHLVKPQAFVDDIKKGKAMVALDVRTPRELGVFAMTLPGSMKIPVDQLFEEENLDRLPTDRPIVVICKSGDRAMAITTALRHSGFEKTYSLVGGISGLSHYLGPKEAYSPPKPAKLTMR